MDCPRCEGKLATETYGGVEIDRCTRCKGIWMDAEELRRARREFLEGGAGALDGQSPAVSDGTKAERVCPRDGAKLETFNYAYSSGIEVDRCGRCGGLWLDNGEFAKIEDFLRRAETSELPADAKLAIASAKERVLTKELERRAQAKRRGPGGSSPIMRLVGWLAGLD